MTWIGHFSAKENETPVDSFEINTLSQTHQRLWLNPKNVLGLN